MADIAPFRALRPPSRLAAKIASLPYDVMNSAEARVAAANNAYSFLHITKAEIDLPEDVDIHSEQVYEKALENLKVCRDNSTLLQEETPAYYIYTLKMNGREQTGLVCGSAVSDYESGVIKKHELTRPEKEQDRINHIRVTGAQTGNVFLAYRPNTELTRIISKWKDMHAPVYDFVAEDGIGHSVWVVDEQVVIDGITSIFDKAIPETYIADGHHRAASAAKVKKALGADAGPEADYFLTTLFPSDELFIMDYNRVVKDLNGLSPAEFLHKLGLSFRVKESGSPVKPDRMHFFGMYLRDQWYELEPLAAQIKSDPIGVLDVSILQNSLLTPVLGIGDPRTDNRIDFVGGIRGLEELEKRVNGGQAAVAFSCYPVSMDQLFDIADSGQIMPPKSTWFEPKLRDGLLTHLIH